MFYRVTEDVKDNHDVNENATEDEDNQEVAAATQTTTQPHPLFVGDAIKINLGKVTIRHFL